VTFVLMDQNRSLVRAWRRAFAGTPVAVQSGDVLQAARGAVLVSPANSFGWMDGGLDAAIARAYAVHGVDITARVQAAIRREAVGELVVGQALVIPTPEGPFRYLMSAPTMRTPRPVPWSLNAYLAFRAVLLAAQAWDAAHPEAPLPTIFVPGLATGAGFMPVRRCARQMRAAWDAVRQPGDPPPLTRLIVQEAWWRYR